MNVTRLKELARRLEAPEGLPVSFNFRHVIEGENFEGLMIREILENAGKCTACIAGEACLLFGELDRKALAVYAKELLGLNEEQADRLFFNAGTFVTQGRDMRVGDVTPAQAAGAVRRLIVEAKKPKVRASLTAFSRAIRGTRRVERP